MPGEETVGTPRPGDEARRRPIASAIRRAILRSSAAGVAATVVHLEPRIEAPATATVSDLWDFPADVHDGASIEGAAIRLPVVSDGLGVLSPGTSNPASGDACSGSPVHGGLLPGIRSLRMLSEPRVRSPWRPEQHPARVRTLTELAAPAVRTPVIVDPSQQTNVVSFGVVTTPRVQSGESWIGAASLATRVRDETKRTQALPHTRVGMPPDEVSPSDTELFLREAEELRGVQRGQAELVAVFRRVPIELITKLGLSQGATQLSFEVGATESRSRTRIHDLAVVRDNSGGQVHLVPHRSRFESVALG